MNGSYLDMSHSIQIQKVTPENVLEKGIQMDEPRIVKSTLHDISEDKLLNIFTKYIDTMSYDVLARIIWDRKDCVRKTYNIAKAYKYYDKMMWWHTYIPFDEHSGEYNAISFQLTISIL